VVVRSCGGGGGYCGCVVDGVVDGGVIFCTCK
jgi:hypothetical protein